MVHLASCCTMVIVYFLAEGSCRFVRYECENYRETIETKRYSTAETGKYAQWNSRKTVENSGNFIGTMIINSVCRTCSFTGHRKCIHTLNIVSHSYCLRFWNVYKFWISTQILVFCMLWVNLFFALHLHNSYIYFFN